MPDVIPVAPAAAPATPTAPVAPTTPVAPSPAPATPAAPAAAPDWMSGLPDTTRGFVTNKGWKGTADVLESYQNLEKLVSTPADKLLKIPASDDAEGWNSVYSRLGRPQQPADYKIEAAKEGGDPKFAEWAAKNFHELGLSTKQGQALAAKFSEYTTGMKTDSEAAALANLQRGQETLKKEWGAAHEQNINIAKRGAAVMGMDKATLDKMETVLGFDGVMKLFHSMGAKTGEGSFTTGNGGNGALTPQAAADKISALKSDPVWVQKYTAGDSGARAEMQRLHEMAYQGDLTL